MSQTIKYGIFGMGEVTRDDEGFIEMPVVIEESGLYVGVPPCELRILEILSHDEPEFNRRYVAKLNRGADLPCYLGTAKIQVLGGLEKVTDEMIVAEGLDPLPDD